MNPTARQVFAPRAAFYATSAAHTDKAVLDRVVELAWPWPGAVVLDVATGTGHTAFALAPHVRRVVGADVTPEMLEQARRLSAERGMRNVDFRLADAHALPFEDQAFDSVTCRRAAHHFTDIARALREIQRVLKPSGRLVIDDRSVPDDDFLDATLNYLDRLHDHSHVREYRPGEWRRLLAEAGFAVETIETYTRHRPLSSLTAGVDAQDAAQVHALVAALDEAQHAALNVAEQDGEVYTNHWYVIAVGIKRDRRARKMRRESGVMRVARGMVYYSHELLRTSGSIYLARAARGRRSLCAEGERI